MTVAPAPRVCRSGDHSRRSDEGSGQPLSPKRERLAQPAGYARRSSSCAGSLALLLESRCKAHIEARTQEIATMGLQRTEPRVVVEVLYSVEDRHPAVA